MNTEHSPRTSESRVRRANAPAVFSIALASCILLPLVCAAESQLRSREINFASGWRITQDVHDIGEKMRWFDPASTGGMGDAIISADFERKSQVSQNDVEDWQEIPRLAHLQVLLSNQPYYGRELRSFNDHAWWYRLEFPTPAGAQKAALRFEGVDYYSKVWLNGTLLGTHEGYVEPFEFEVGNILKTEKANVLIVEVSSPWDKSDVPWGHWAVKRNMLKGTYEHADGMIQQNVNPVGIFKPVKLILHDDVREENEPWIRTSLADDTKSATIAVSWPLWNDGAPQVADLTVKIVSLTDDSVAAQAGRPVDLIAGANSVDQTLTVHSPRLWSTWDRGTPALYRAKLTLSRPGKEPISRSVDFGIRTVELRRSASETRLYLNGKPVYLRGTCYIPDIYLSNMDRSRYERDVMAAVRAGMNAFRIHVHTEDPEFYKICDRAGVVVFQDFDLNWNFPEDEEFTGRAVKLFGAMIRKLRNHPSVAVWIAMNEVYTEFYNTVRPGPQLVAEAKRIDGTRPVIKSAGMRDDLESGDGHDYRGSFRGGTRYTEIFGTTEKLNTEFGIKTPPTAERLRLAPEVADRLKDVLPRVSELHDYQYRLLKYYIEHYRIQKYAPNAGYFQFVWSDYSPQHFTGIYDFWGLPKVEGLGGGLRALEESNQPIGIFMEYKDTPVALHAVNDSSDDLGDVTASWRVTLANDEVVSEGTRDLRLGPDSHVRIGDLTFVVKPDQVFRVVLNLFSKDGKQLAHNVYVDPFHEPERPQGYPERIDHEILMPLWWAGLKK